MSAVVAKILAMFLLGGLSLLVAALPLKLRRHFESSRGGSGGWFRSSKAKKTVLSLLLCFGGGVLLATCFVHMLPECRDNLHHSGYHALSHIPIAEIILCSGFFIIYFIEETVLFFTSDESDDISSIDQIQRTFSLRGNKEPEVNPAPNQESNPNELSMHQRNPNEQEDRRNIDEPDSQQNYNPKYAGHLKPSTKSMFPNYHTPDNVDLGKPKIAYVRSTGRHRPVRDFLTMVALTFHALFEGLAVGLEDQARDVWTLFAAITTHKLVITFCISLELITADTPTSFYVLYMATFALISPIGIAIGTGISEGTEYPEGHFLTVGILQAISAGAILYVVVFEVLQREKSKVSISGLMQLGFVILGFSTMLGIELLGGHMHDHSFPTSEVTNSTVLLDHDDHPHHPLGHPVNQEEHGGEAPLALESIQNETKWTQSGVLRTVSDIQKLETQPEEVDDDGHIHLPQHDPELWQQVEDSGIILLNTTQIENPI